MRPSRSIARARGCDGQRDSRELRNRARRSAPTRAVGRRHALRSSMPRSHASTRRIHERLTWKFASTAEQFKHDTTAKLVSDLTAFVDPDPRRACSPTCEPPRLRRVRRAGDDRQVRRRSGPTRSGRSPTRRVPEVRRPQDQAAARADPDREGPGLGLWEFAHLQTTAPGTDPIPKRGPGRPARRDRSRRASCSCSFPAARSGWERSSPTRTRRRRTRTSIPSAEDRRVPDHRGDARSVLHVEVRDDAGAVAAARRKEPEPVRPWSRTSAARSSICGIRSSR